MYIALKDCEYGTNSWKKGEDVKVSSSVAEKMKAKGEVGDKHPTSKKKEKAER